MHRSHDASLALAHDLACPSYGLVSRQRLRAHGLDRHRLRRFVLRGELVPHGTHAVRVTSAQWDPHRSPIVAALINSGPAAWVEGESALVIAGLTGRVPTHIDIGVPENAASRQADGARRHRLRTPPPLRHSPVLHAEPAHAALRAAAWSSTDAEAATLLGTCVTQHLVLPEQLEAALTHLPALARRAFLADAARELRRRRPSLFELDLPRECRRHGLPEPDDCTVTSTPSGPMIEALWSGPDVTLVIEPSHAHAADLRSGNPPWEVEAHGDDAIGRVVTASQADLQGMPESVFAPLRTLLHEPGDGRS